VPTGWWAAMVPAQHKKEVRSLSCRFGDLKQGEHPSAKEFCESMLESPELCGKSPAEQLRNNFLC